MPISSSDTPGKKGLDALQIRAALIQLGSVERGRMDLSRFGIEVAAIKQQEFLQGDARTLSAWDVVLIHCPHELVAADGPSPAVRMLLGVLAGTGVGICVILDYAVETARHWLTGGADAVGFADDSQSLLAVAVHTAHNTAVMRRSLTRQVAELEQKLEATQLINRAKSIMAQQLQITEMEALQRLRQQSRSQRRRMSDLAKVIIEAHLILQGNSNGRNLAPRSEGPDVGGISAAESIGDDRPAEFDEEETG